MPKPSDDVQDLKRRLALLERLEARALGCAEGVVLFEPVRVRDPRPLLRALAAGAPPVAAVVASLELGSPPTVLTVALLAAARRDLRVLEAPRARALTREAPRIFRRYGDLDEAWLSRRRASLARLADRLHALDAGPAPPWTRALDAIRLAHGDDAGAVVERAMEGATGSARARERTGRFLAAYALAFDPRPRRGGELVVTPEDVDRDLDALDAVLHAFGALALTLDEVLGLRALDLGKHTGPIAALVAEGLAVAKVRRLAELGRAGDLSRIRGDADAAGAYADWAGALVPHYAALGLDVPLSPEVFERLRRGTRKEDLAVLAVCLMKHHSKASADTAGEALARLDATLGLFQRRPAEAASILTELSGTSPGAGREALPEVAAWLGDDALLDRYVHLSRLAGAPVPLSRALRVDLDRARRLASEREHLEALPTRTPEQEERLHRLATGAVAPPDPAKTRRRLADRLRELTARAYERRLDAVFRRILKQVWGIVTTELTPAWRDAIRFYLAVEDNRELLATVLRGAAAGADLARTLPKNRAWIEEVSARPGMDVEAWLAPRPREVTLGDRVHRLAVEEDPVEVLRMGIPFDTCLALDEGVNAASTVVNAADANKRVIYLRDPAGRIVARKLVAVSEAGALLGYRLYVAAHEHEAAILAAFATLCAEMATAARLPLAREGKPRQIHPGFWYDDGPVAFDEAPEDAPVKAYCASLGLAAPARPSARLRAQARLFGAVRAGDLEGVLGVLRDTWGGLRVHARAAEWVLGQLPRARLITEARRSRALANTAVARAAAEGPLRMLEMATQLSRTASSDDSVDRLLASPRTAEIAFALVAAALGSRSHGPELDGYGLDHEALRYLPVLAGALPVEEALALCDRLDPLLRWLAATGCADCAQGCERPLLDAIVVAYASARDPSAVLRALASARSNTLTARAALRLAARYALAADAPAPALPPPRLQPLHPSRTAHRALAKLRAHVPELDADPSMLAAVLRQAGAVPREGKLPVPREAPFEALGDLLVQLDLTEIVAPWSGAGVAALPWEPGPWELYHHRRRRTGRRAALIEAARTSGAARSDACAALARLGDAGVLTSLLRELPPRKKGVRSPAHEVLESSRSHAEDVATQVKATAAADPLGEIPANMKIEILDHGLLAQALERVEHPVTGGTGGDARALEIALRDEVPEPIARHAAALVAARAPLEPADRTTIRRFLRERKRTSATVAPDLALAFGAVVSLREDLVVALASFNLSLAFPAVQAALERAGQGALMDDLAAPWLRAALEQSSFYDLAHMEDAGLFLRVVRVLLAEGSAPSVLGFYRDIDDPALAAVFLDELSRSPQRTSPAMGEALRSMEAWMADADNHAMAGWLRACVETR